MRGRLRRVPEWRRVRDVPDARQSGCPLAKGVSRPRNGKFLQNVTCVSACPAGGVRRESWAVAARFLCEGGEGWPKWHLRALRVGRLLHSRQGRASKSLLRDAGLKQVGPEPVACEFGCCDEHGIIALVSSGATLAVGCLRLCPQGFGVREQLPSWRIQRQSYGASFLDVLTHLSPHLAPCGGGLRCLPRLLQLLRERTEVHALQDAASAL